MNSLEVIFFILLPATLPLAGLLYLMGLVHGMIEEGVWVYIVAIVMACVFWVAQALLLVVIHRIAIKRYVAAEVYARFVGAELRQNADDDLDEVVDDGQGQD